MQTAMQEHFTSTLQQAKSLEILHAGGLRLNPESAALWAALGAADPEAAVREHCTARALALDPLAAPVWAGLGRLYAEHASDGPLAAQSYATARARDPACVQAWEGMGALEAASRTGEQFGIAGSCSKAVRCFATSCLAQALRGNVDVLVWVKPCSRSLLCMQVLQRDKPATSMQETCLGALRRSWAACSWLLLQGSLWRDSPLPLPTGVHISTLVRCSLRFAAT